MLKYVLYRLLLIPLTLLGIMTVNFIFIQAAPGGPVEQTILKLQGDANATGRISGGTGDAGRLGTMKKTSSSETAYRGAQGLDPALIKELERQFGFDKPAPVRFFKMIKNYALFDFGKSFYKDESVVSLIFSKLPVSASLGIWSTLLIYLISVPLGIRKALKDGSTFDSVTGWLIVAGYAVPAFLFAMLLIVLFAGGAYFSWFPVRGLVSDDFADLSFFGKIKDYFHHLVLPVAAMTAGGFASLTMLTKNSFLEEIGKQYVLTAKAKGLSENRILYGHIFRNAMLIVIAGFPAVLTGMLFTGSVLIEVVFSLDGLGLLGFESVMTRDYPVVFGTLYLFSLLGLVLNLISDLTYRLIDPRIDFSGKSYD